MVVVIEGIVFCVVFTIMVYSISREPIKTLYNYPPMIQMRVKSLEQYKDKIPTEKNKILAKSIASVLIIIVISLILRYVNGYTTFQQGFWYGLLLWTIVNLYDVIVLDIIWFCHDKQFVFEGTEDMVNEYHNYWYHIKGGLIGEALAVLICAIVGLIIQFIL
ncbi:MAG: hypothetical protein IKE91_03595 [Clostridia bacterium]|nr:hypothetical protein [Clostridia bacterium]